MLTYGVDHAAEQAALFSGRVALVTSPTGRNSRGESTASVLQHICNLQFLLAPEHGLRGNRAAGETFDREIDPETGLEVLSLYTGSSKRLAPEALRQIDTIVYDIQDVGCRFYTFISTLKILLEDCAAHQKRLIVLDRPNPLGNRIEGCQLQPEAESFVGCYSIPICYGLTCGEFARMVNDEQQLHCDLHVIPCRGWTREQTFPSWGMDWVKPSPNIPDFETVLLYPGTCLIEGTNLSEGRGTDAPFALIGAPFVDNRLFAAMAALHLPGVSIEPEDFTPTASKHAGTLCHGIRLRVTDAESLRPTELGIRLIKAVMELYPESLELTAGEGMPFLSQLAGHRLMKAPGWDADALIRQAQQDSLAFRKRAARYHIY